jgi:dolichyl-diphosphooligosaccharide---protein glycosyltransferase subunit 4
MISDGELYRLAIFLGSSAMVLIVVYHYLEVNAKAATKVQTKPSKVAA